MTINITVWSENTNCSFEKLLTVTIIVKRVVSSSVLSNDMTLSLVLWDNQITDLYVHKLNFDTHT